MPRVLLINPDDTAQGGFSNPPLGLAYLAGTLEKHKIDVRIVDGYLAGRHEIEKQVKGYEPDIVGITCYTPGRIQALSIATWVKRYRDNILTVIGGAHPTIMWKQILHHYPDVDICVLGEGEQTLVEIALNYPRETIQGIARRDDGSAIRNSSREYVTDLDSIPFPAWHLLPLNKYPARGQDIWNGIDLSKEPRVSVIYTRGCSASCEFCSTWWIWKGHRSRSANNMCDELDLLSHVYNVKHIVFADDAFSVDMRAAKELCQTIIDRRLKLAWMATTRVDAVDRELLALMRRAGCYEISYGVESGSQRLLDKMGKKASVETAKQAISATRQVGIQATALLIVGNQGETKESINETVDFLREANPNKIGSVGGLWIFPGTVLYQHAKHDGLIDDSFWLTDQDTPVYLAEHTRKDLEMFLLAVDRRKKLGTLDFWIAYLLEPVRRFLRQFPIARKIYIAIRRH